MQAQCEHDAYFLASISSETSTQISYANWKFFSQGNKWHRFVLDALEKPNPYCSFAFKNSWVKKANSRKSSSVSFRCSGSCTFTGCPLEFKVEIMYFNIHNPPEILQMTVSFTSSFVRQERKKERRSRHLHGLERKHTHHQLYTIYLSAHSLNLNWNQGKGIRLVEALMSSERLALKKVRSSILILILSSHCQS